MCVLDALNGQVLMKWRLLKEARLFSPLFRMLILILLFDGDSSAAGEDGSYSPH